MLRQKFVRSALSAFVLLFGPFVTLFSLSIAFNGGEEGHADRAKLRSDAYR